MYSDAVVQRTIRDFEKRNGWTPTFHTVAECDERREYIDSIADVAKSKTGARSYWFWKDDKAPTERRIKEIKRWVQNERFLSFASAEYFVTRYAFIRAANTQIVHFNFRIAQKIFLAFLAECDDMQIAIQLFILKARQLGVSTVTALFFLQRILYIANTYAIMASVQVPQSQKLKNMIDTCQDNLPFWLRVYQTSTKASEPRWTNGSRLSVQAGAQEVGIGQGDSPSCLHICLHPQTLIRLAHGEVREIANVWKGDKVITSTGRIAAVKAAVQSPRPPEVACELSLWGNYSPLIVTRDHPILTPDGFVHAEDLAKGDFVSMPVRWIGYGTKEISIFHRPTGWHGHKETRTTKEQKIALTPEFGWLCGLYLSEGSLHRNVRLPGKPVDSIYFSIHRKERERTEKGIRAVLGGSQKLNCCLSKKSLTATVSFSNAALARWLEENFGCGAEGKKIPDWVFDSGDFIDGLVKGYFEGDGHISPRASEVMGHSISLPLLIQMRDLLASMGIGWSSLYHQPAGLYYGRNCRAQWMLQVSGDASRRLRDRMGWPSAGKIPAPGRSQRALKWRYSPDQKFVYIQVFENRPSFSESFYDLEVDAEEHDFCTIHCCVKNSELGDYTNPKHTLDEGLFPACHQLPSLFMVLEGTGSTATTWQKESWNLYSEGKGRFTAFFIPPACATDLYPPESFLRQHPVPEPWESFVTDRTRKMRRRGELFVRQTPYLYKFLGQHWEMSKEFQWFWQCGYEEAVAKHAEREFLAANAVTPEDAFQSKDDPVFTQETINMVTEAREKSYVSYAVTGRTILMGNENTPYRPNAEDVNEREPEIVLDWEGIDGNEYRWNLIPLKQFDDSTDAACFDRLLIFEPPEHGAEYAISIDTAHGLNTPNEDRCALRVHRYGRGREPDRQVASFNSVRVNAPQTARIAAAIAVLYGTDGNKNVTAGNPLLAKFIIEQVRKPGDECQHQLKIMGFLDHHIMHRYDSKGNIDPNKGTQEGWFTRTYTRSILLYRYVDAVNTGWLVINDPISIRQLATFVRKHSDGRPGRMEHETGQHDDGLFADAMAWTTLHDLENSAQRIQSRWPLEKKVKEAVDGWCSREMLIDGGSSSSLPLGA